LFAFPKSLLLGFLAGPRNLYGFFIRALKSDDRAVIVSSCVSFVGPVLGLSFGPNPISVQELSSLSLSLSLSRFTVVFHCTAFFIV
jgi:hypothetical protein